ncbi:hypothetical protein [Kitasatospora herbaricolor]|uniref:Uncharacterized protein n=1 Tax=Kitasatospora herbaricolor TaxID=68217 RepID=A0ABZ1W0K9_9ACTN|nr:hypothetical protein [Kitasatospora herbaricolor]
MPPAAKKISIDQACRLFTAMGLPLHTPGPDGADGFTATARGGRTGIQPVKAAERITLHYRYAGGYQLLGPDVQEPSPDTPDPVLAEIRSHFAWAVQRAPDHGHTITWTPGTAYLTPTRAAAPATTEPPTSGQP